MPFNGRGTLALDEYLRLFFRDRGDDGGLQVAGGAVLVEQRVEHVRSLGAGELDPVDGAAPAVTAGVVDESDAQSLVGGGLQPSVDGGVDLVAGGLRLRTKATDDFQPDHLGDIRRFDVGERAMRPGTNYFVGCGLDGGCIDESELEHPAQDILAPVGRTLRVRDRVELRR